MKTLTKFLTMLALLTTAATGAWAQQPEIKSTLLPMGGVNPSEAIAHSGVLKTDKTDSPAANVRKAPRRSMGLVTPPADATAETYYTTSGTFNLYTSSWSDYTSQMSSIQVIVSGNDIYISGLAYYTDSWIKGTIDGNTATFPTSQQVDDDEEYPEWINGSDDGSEIADIVFTIDQEAGTLTAETSYICECAAESSLNMYGYWSQPTFSKTAPELPETVEVSDEIAATAQAYSFDAQNYFNDADYSAPVYIAVDGDDVYVKGICAYLPEAWLKGSLSGTTITIPTGQFFGTVYDTYNLYFVGYYDWEIADVELNYNATTGEWTTDQLILVTDSPTSLSPYEAYMNIVFRKSLILNDEADNCEDLAALHGYTVDVTLGRTINTGGWNTLTVPFDVTAEQLATALGEDVKVKVLSASSLDTESKTLTLEFGDATTIEAGKPYLVKLADDAESVTNPTFTGIVLNNDVATTETAYVDFVPVVNATTIGSEGDKVESVLFIGAGDKLYNPTAMPARMKGFRAYFNVHDEAASARHIVLDIEGEGTTEVYEILKMNDEISAPAYNLAGQRVDGGYKGIVIVNGKKIVK